MTVPNVPPAVRRPPIEPVSNQETVSPPGPLTVLVVDDYPAVLAWASWAFERAGWRILTATDGPEAEALFDDAANRGEPVDLLVTDLQLPAVSGAALVRRMRALNGVTGHCDLRGCHVRRRLARLDARPYVVLSETGACRHAAGRRGCAPRRGAIR